MRYTRDYSVGVIDRVMSALSYLSAGWIGLIYCLVLYFSKKHISGFVRFNVTQSIFFALAYFIISILLNFILSLLSHIPIIQVIVSWFQLLFFRPLIWHYSLLQLIINAFILYFVIYSLIGRKPYIYKISAMLDR